MLLLLLHGVHPVDGLLVPLAGHRHRALVHLGDDLTGALGRRDLAGDLVVPDQRKVLDKDKKLKKSSSSPQCETVCERLPLVHVKVLVGSALVRVGANLGRGLGQAGNPDLGHLE